MERIIIHVDLDSFYASVEELRKPEIKGKPIVICAFSGRGENSGAVATSNYKAREMGIKAGMPISQARLLSKNTDTVFLPMDKPYYSEISERIMNMLEDEADIMQQVSIDEAYLDITKRAASSYESAKLIAEKIKEKLFNSEGLTCSIGIGPNKLVSKMASKYKKPNGLTIVFPEQVSDFFSKIPLSKLHGIGPKALELLEKIGIKTTQELANADIKKLEDVFGLNKAIKLQEIARGIDNSPVEPKEKQQLSRLSTLKSDTNNADAIFEKMKELLDDLERKIEKSQISFKTISIIIIDTSLKMQTKSETIQQTHSLKNTIPVFRKLVYDFLKENPSTVVRRVGVRVSNLTYHKKQRTLFDFRDAR